MASINLVTCDGCGNILVPGDVISITSKGVLGTIDGDGIEVIEVEGSQSVHLCDTCATETARTLNGLIEDRMERDLASDCCTIEGACTGSCVAQAD